MDHLRRLCRRVARVLRAASLHCAVQIGNPADSSNPSRFVHTPSAKRHDKSPCRGFCMSLGGEGGIIRRLRRLTLSGRSLAAQAARSLRRLAPSSRTDGFLSNPPPPNHQKSPRWGFFDDGGEGGIRTHGTELPYTCFPSMRLRPLGHLSGRRSLSHVWIYAPTGSGW